MISARSQGGTIDENAFRESRRQLRRVMEQLLRTAVEQGATQERISMVEVIAHPTLAMPELNFITPRRNTAFVSGQYLQQGIEGLRAKGRAPRIHYIDGLFPPTFTQLVRDLNFVLEREITLMLHFPGVPLTDTSEMGASSSTVNIVSTPEAWAVWTALWRTPFNDVNTTVKDDPLEITRADVHTFLIWEAGIAVGGARLRISRDPQDNTVIGHIETVFLTSRDYHSPAMQHLTNTVLQHAYTQQCAFVFTFAETDTERAPWNTLGFVDTSSLLYYVGALHRSEDS